ncbi:MAG: RNA methyltransferase, partial [Lachnospiraceae bacterium]|nr:RNA methyltransferase [Lachnospiraceae bacterium]
VNPTNVGAITRCAAALGMDGMITTFDTVNPLYRRSARVSMGTVFQIPWTVAPKSAENGKNLIAVLKEAGFTTAAMALTDVSLPVNDPGIRDHEKIAVVLGTEGYGLPDEVIAACDFAIKIPMYHGVDSLNVAAAAAVCFWELIR